MGCSPLGSQNNMAVSHLNMESFGEAKASEPHKRKHAYLVSFPSKKSLNFLDWVQF